MLGAFSPNTSKEQAERDANKVFKRHLHAKYYNHEKAFEFIVQLSLNVTVRLLM
jgi:hypothetical protein